MTRTALRRGFVFTVDAFVALLLALVLIPALMFFVHIPGVYYERFEQVQDVARDAMTSLSVMPLSAFENSPNYTIANLTYAELKNGADKYAAVERNVSASVLEQIAVSWSNGDTRFCGLSQEFLERMIPRQYGFSLLVYNSSSGSWETLYSSSVGCGGGATRTVQYARAQFAEVRVVSGVKLHGNYTSSKFEYNSCHGGQIPCEPIEGQIDFEKLLPPLALKLVVWV
ncbi:MAG: hypothetical protein AB1468_00450 [Candidatus Micrarchaeota archaeon]